MKGNGGKSEESDNQQNHRLHHPLCRVQSPVLGHALSHPRGSLQRQKSCADRPVHHRHHWGNGVDHRQGAVSALRKTFGTQTVQYRQMPVLREKDQ